MTIELPNPPSANKYWRRVGNYTILSKEARDYKLAVRAACVQQGIKPLRGDLRASVWWRRARRSGDLDNISKGLFDAIKGHAYEDDKQLVEIHLYRSDDKTNPGITVEVSSAQTPPQSP